MEESEHSFSESESDRSTEESLDRQGTSWIDVAWLMISDIVGTSVLAFAGLGKRLGTVPTVALIVGLFPASLYVSVLMTRTRELVLKTAALQGRPAPRVDTMGEVAGHVFGSSGAGNTVYAAVYGYTLLGQASYLLVLGTSLQQVFFTANICIYTTVAAGCGALLVPVIVIRQLGESVLLCFINLLLIVAVLAIALVAISGQGRASCTEVHSFAPGLTLMSIMGAATNVVYSYAGQWMYFEIMETMRNPSDFPKAFAVTGPFMVSIYLVVALMAYSLGVRTDDLIASVPPGPDLRATSSLLFLHVLIVYLIKSIVLQQYFHLVSSPSDIDERTALSYLKHGGWGAAFLMFGFLVANVVPFFSQLLGLIGGFLSGPINFLLPILLYLVALGRHSSVGASNNDEREETKEPFLVAAWRAVATMRASGLALISCLCLFVVLTMVLGVADVLKQIAQLRGEHGMAFSCHALDTVLRGGSPWTSSCV